MHMRDQAERHFGVHIDFTGGFKFKSQAYEGDVLHGASVLTDEPDPVGTNAGPSTPAMLAMAVGHCLSASLVETLRHAGIHVQGLSTEAIAVVALNEEGLPRISRIDVTIRPVVDKESGNIKRCVDVFERYCTVCQSIRPAIPVHVEVSHVVRQQEAV
ncbi:OsmC family protein [Azohydromonas aeria]|uniref:OsmC family protein n=1 Tax=Azohydromonas aeria TaxID=2590212 RepID=UPI0012FA0148|nr:OsmC family protein [Azohydromonas aeria]